ncbi:MAG: hypothetical protein HQ475_06690 [SAR202 cluster bacterium]|nr:hypothetical protein [SAR202 cluster bacterium]
MTNHQRIGSISNSHVGREFENLALEILTQKGIHLRSNHSINVGLGDRKKAHKFDLGSDDPAVIVECKAQTWTSGDKVPSAKMKNWSEAMFYFAIAPQKYRKIFFIQKSVRHSNGETLGAYYLRTHFHLIPENVEFWECDPETKETTILEKELSS